MTYADAASKEENDNYKNECLAKLQAHFASLRQEAYQVMVMCSSVARL